MTDGEHLYVFFGSRGLYCLDMKGESIWSKDLGRMHTLHAHGEGSWPVLHGDTLFFLRHNQNILSRLEPATGKPHGEALRLDGITDFIFASPVGGAGLIYVTGHDGTTVVLRHDRENATLAVNHLDDSFSASPALAGPEFYLRGERFLYCIAEPQPEGRKQGH